MTAKGTRSFFHECILARPENRLEVDLWIQYCSSTEANVKLSWYSAITYYSSTKLSPRRWMLSWCSNRFSAQKDHFGGWSQVVLEPRPEPPGKDFFFPLHIIARAPQKANLPITRRKSQLCCVFNLRGPIWRHHRVMRSDTFSFLIAVSPVA